MELGNGTETKTQNGDEGTETSGRIVMVSTYSKSMAKVPLRGSDDTLPPASSVGGKEKMLSVKSEGSKEGLLESNDTHAWQPLNPVVGNPVVGDNTDTSDTNDNKVPVPGVISPPLDTPSTALQNLDELKKQTDSCSRGNSVGSKQGMSQGTNQGMTPSRLVSLHNHSSDDSEDASRKKKDREAKFSLGKDFFCWICHKEKANVSCSKCPRSFHPKCLLSSGFHHSSLSVNARRTSSTGHDIICPECKSISDLERRPPRALKTVSKEELNSLLVYVIDSVKPSADPSFHVPVIRTMFPDYYENVINPTDFEAIEKKVRSNEYSSTQAFLSDVRWIVHNCCIYNNHTHPLTSNAKSFMKLTTTKIVDLEICPDCFKHFHVKPKTWFTEVCRKAHSLVWAKVIGHPFWPGKVVQIDPVKKEADVRFFGAHDRAWLSVDQCFLITENNSRAKSKNSRSKFDAALKELNEHIGKIESKLGMKFPFADGPKVPIDVKKPFIKLPKRDGDVSSEEEEDVEEVEDPELEIDESVEEVGEKESGGSKEREKNGSEGGSERETSPQKPLKSEPSKSEPPKPELSKSAKKRRLSQTKEESRSKKTAIPGSEESVKVESEKKSIRDGDDPMVDVIPLEEKDIGTLRRDIEKLREMVLKERERCVTVVSEEKRKWEGVVGEMKQTYMKEKERAVRESRSKLESVHAIAIAETKKQQWCAQCAQPAVYYCCWNTSYCSYDCQNNHWQIHMATCQQSRQTQHTNR